MTQNCKKELEQCFDKKRSGCSDELEKFKAILQEAAKHMFDKNESNDWFDDQDKEIKKLLENKKLNRNELKVRDRCRTNGSKKRLRKPNDMRE